MNKLLLLCIVGTILFYSQHLNGQITFQKSFGEENIHLGGAYSVIQTSDGGYMIGANGSNSNTGEDMMLIKTDEYGDITWLKTYGSLHQDGIRCVRETSDGGYVFTGPYHAPTDFGISAKSVLVKVDVNGNVIWSKTYGGDNDAFYYVEETSDNGFLISGQTPNNAAGQYDMNVIKTDAFGDDEWSTILGTGGLDFIGKAHPTSDGNYIACGTKFIGAGRKDYFLTKLDATGDTLWTKTYGGMGDDIARDVVETPDQGFLVVGTSWSFGAEAYLIRTDMNGDTLWTRTFGAWNTEWPYEVKLTDDNGFIMAVDAWQADSASYDAGLIKLDVDGNIQWSRFYCGGGWDQARSVDCTDDGGYVFVGQDRSFQTIGVNNIYFVKTDANGVSGCHEWTPEFSVSSPPTLMGAGIEVNNSFGSLDELILTGTDSISVVDACTIPALCVYTSVVELNNKNRQLTVFPNPTSHTLSIKNPAPGESAKVLLYSFTGVLISQQSVEGTNEIVDINVESLPFAIYYLQYSCEKEVWYGKVVVE